MENKIYRIEPVFEERIWGTKRLQEKYGYKTNLNNIAEVYNVCGMPGHLDNIVSDTGLHLSEFYKQNKDMFGSDTEEMPVEICMAHSNSYLSIQVHPDDEYALEHEGTRGRPEGWTIIEGPEKSEMEIGNKAHTKEEFIELSESKQWDKLFRYIQMEKYQYIHVPAGSLHAFCKDAVAVAFSNNADVTYRLYDFDRIDAKTGKPRDLHIQKVYDTIKVPDDEINAFWPEIKKDNGCEISLYHDEPGVYTAGRIKVDEVGKYNTENFMFYCCVEGEGFINDEPIKAGETLFVPRKFGEITIKGPVDLMYVTYRNR